jgi:hypothetical protein
MIAFLYNTLWGFEIEDATRKRGIAGRAGAGLGDHESTWRGWSFERSQRLQRVIGQIDCRTRTSSSSESFAVSRRWIARATLVAWIFACSATGP